MTDREVMQQALEALEFANVNHWWGSLTIEKAIISLRAALEQQAEPVAWMDREGDLYKMPEIKNWAPPHTMLYTAPPQRRWVGLTEEQRLAIVESALRGHASTRDAIMWSIEYVMRHYGIKEGT